MAQARYVRFVLRKSFPSEAAGVWVDVHGCDHISTYHQGRPHLYIPPGTTTSVCTTRGNHISMYHQGQPHLYIPPGTTTSVCTTRGDHSCTYHQG